MNDETVALKKVLTDPKQVREIRVGKTVKKSKAALIIALTLTTIWGAACVAYVIAFPNMMVGVSENPISLVIIALTAFVPIVLIWFVALLADAMDSLKFEASSLRSEMANMQASSDSNLPVPVPQPTHMEISQDSWIKEQLTQITTLAKQTEGQVADIALKTSQKRRKSDANRNAPALPIGVSPDARDLNQPALPLTGPTHAEGAPITVQEFLKALNFPDSPEDREGFRVMRRAKEVRTLSQLLTTCQSLLSMLSQDGIYMDDLKPDPTDPEIWRRYAQGERNASTTTLGAIRDRSALALARNRMRVDTDFRATVHSYLVQFLDTLSHFEPNAEDTELLELADTRSGKAFMLLGRLVGTFDNS